MESPVTRSMTARMETETIIKPAQVVSPETLLQTAPSNRQREFYPALNGLRVLLTFWVVLFHTAWHYAMFVPKDNFLPLFESLPGFITSGLNGVDWFFVLTGFLLAQPIFAGQRTGGWFNFVWMRITRLYPMYFVALGFFCLIVSQKATLPYLDWDQHISHVLRPLIDKGLADQGLPPSQGIPNNCHLSWTNLLFLNNFVPFGGCMGWTWSLAIQVHFILIFPLIVKWFGTGKSFLKWCALMTGIWMISRYLILTVFVQAYPFDPPPLYIYEESYIEQFFVLFNIWYSSTPQRIGCIFSGAILAWIQVNKPTRITNLHKYPIITWSLSAFAAIAIWLNSNIHMQDTWTAFFFSVGGLAHVVAISTIVYMLINQLGPLAYFNTFLSSNIMKKLAYPSYGVYLVHSFFIVWIFRGPLLKPHENLGVSKLAISFSIIIVLSYTFAYLSTRFVEEPIKAFLRDYVDPAPKLESADKKKD